MGMDTDNVSVQAQAAWPSEVRRIDPSLQREVKDAVKQGTKLLDRSPTGQVTPALLSSWIGQFADLISRIDPLGAEYSSSVTGNLHATQSSARHVHRKEDELSAIFGAQLGLARSLAAGNAKVVTTRNLSLMKSQSLFHGRDVKPDRHLVFVLMPFTEAWSSSLWQQVKSIVEGSGKGLICRRADDLFGRDVMCDIYDSIQSARIIIADVTNRNANVFYELGIAHALEKNVIILSQDPDQVPFDLKRFRVGFYRNDIQGAEDLKKFIVESLSSILALDSKSP